MGHINIPIFIPHLGCPNQCIFCNQRHISGQIEFDENDVRNQMKSLIDVSINTMSMNTLVRIVEILKTHRIELEMKRKGYYIDKLNKVIDERKSMIRQYLNPQIGLKIKENQFSPIVLVQLVSAQRIWRNKIFYLP
jgi:hypothetical protein